MPADAASAERRFAPSPLATLVALILAALCVRLGFWQWHRGLERQEAWTRFARGAERVLDLEPREGTRERTIDVAALGLYQRVRLRGRLDGAHQFLLDNRTYRGSAGYEVLTPLAREGAPALLVDRGWVPFTGSRARLPQVSLTAQAPVTLTGRIAELPAPGLASGRAAPDPGAPWPKLTSYPSLAELSAALGEPLAPRILLLDPGEPFGFVRDWQPPGLPPLRHFSYAIQWWIFAALALGGWVLLSVRATSGARG
jgi:surfeit locus 1 family protein